MTMTIENAVLIDNGQSPLLTSSDAAKLLAISARTLWDLAKAGDIPRVRIGHSIRYDPADLKAYVTRQKQLPDLG